MLDENELEQTVLSWLSGLGCTVLSGPDIAPGELLAERAEFGEVVLKTRLRDTLARLNPALDATALMKQSGTSASPTFPDQKQPHYP